MRALRTEAYRAFTHWVFECHADPGFFGDERTLTAAHHADLAAHNGLPCDGGGVPGPWCEHCRFGHDEETH